MSCSNASRRAGFTIVEVVMAMGILLIGSAALIGFFTFGSATARHAQLRTQAATALEAVMADIDHSLFPFVNGELGEPIAIDKRPVPGVPGVVYSAKAVANPDLPLEYRIDVELTWESAGTKRSKSWSTLKTKELAFGERLRREFIEKETSKPPPSKAPSSKPEGAESQDDTNSVGPSSTSKTAEKPKDKP